MSDPIVIGIDQGTRSTRSIVLSSEKNILFDTRVPVTLHQNGLQRVEQDAAELLQSVRRVLDQAIVFATTQQLKIAAIGLATQRSGVCAWHRLTGEPLSPLLSWADTRTELMIREISHRHRDITRITSLPVLAHYAAGKISLLQHQFPDSDVLIGTLDSFLLWHLDASRPFVTDDTMAARTMLYSLEDRGWDSQLAEIFDVESGRLSEIRASIEKNNPLTCGTVPITAIMGDQQAALVGIGLGSLDCLINFGSVISLLIPTGNKKVDSPGFVTSFLYTLQRSSEQRAEYLIEGIVNAGARVLDHLLLEKGYISCVEEIEGCCRRSQSTGAKGVLFLPLGGTGSPDWVDHLPTRSIDLPADSTDDYVRAAIENVAGFVIRQVEILRERGILEGEPRIGVSGGLSNVDYLIEYISSCCQLSLFRLEVTEATVRGVAIAASWGVGEASRSQQSFQDMKREKIASPLDGSVHQRYQRWFSLYQEVVASI